MLVYRVDHKLKNTIMKTIITNQKNNLEKLAKGLEIGALVSLGDNANGQWIAEYTTNDDVIMTGDVWFPIHSCFTSMPNVHLSSS